MAPALIDAYPSAAPCYVSHVAPRLVSRTRFTFEPGLRWLSFCGLRMVGGTGSADGDRWAAVQLARSYCQAQWGWCGYWASFVGVFRRASELAGFVESTPARCGRGGSSWGFGVSSAVRGGCGEGLHGRDELVRVCLSSFGPDSLTHCTSRSRCSTECHRHLCNDEPTASQSTSRCLVPPSSRPVLAVQYSLALRWMFPRGTHLALAQGRKMRGLSMIPRSLCCKRL